MGLPSRENCHSGSTSQYKGHSLLLSGEELGRMCHHAPMAPQNVVEALV